MDYFKILNLSREPFSNSPDPDFFFHSGKHIECLQKTELSLRLLRGLSVIIGDVGTGKTTLCRQLIRNFADDEKMETHLILDPHFSSPVEFLNIVAGMFGVSPPEGTVTDWQLKENIKKYLFHRGVDEGKTIILIIDEGQKLPVFCLEILREFLNYETNEHKLLQIVIFAQREFDTTLKHHKNFADRINLYHILGPLNFQETRAMIRFRLERASAGKKGRSFFSYPALWAIYRGSKGYPRQIINLCHQIALAVLIQNRTKAGWPVARSCIKRGFPTGPKKWQWSLAGALACLLAAAFVLMLAPEYYPILIPKKEKADFSETAGPQTELSSSRLGQAILSQAENKGISETNPMALNALDLFPEGFSEEDTHALVSDMRLGTALEEKRVGTDIQAEKAAQEKTATTGLQQGIHLKKRTIDSPVYAESGILPEQKPEQQPIVAMADSGAEKKEDIAMAGLLEPMPVIAYPDQSETGPPPNILGQITATENDTLSTMIEKVYGFYSRKYLRSVLHANNRIKNPHHIMDGQVIRFPAFPAKAGLPSQEYRLVHISTKDCLEDAYRFLKTNLHAKPSMEMIPYRNNRDGLKFLIVCDEVFRDEESARNALNKLPPEFASEATILGQWEEDTVFFVNRLF